MSIADKWEAKLVHSTIDVNQPQKISQSQPGPFEDRKVRDIEARPALFLAAHIELSFIGIVL